MIAIEPFDAATAPDDELYAFHEFETLIQREVEPDDPIEPLDVATFNYRTPPSWQRHLRWVARDGGAIVGTAFVELEYTETNRHLAWFDVAVHPDHRRERIGTALLVPLVEAARADERTVLGADPAQGSGGERFLAALDMEMRLLERRSRLLMHELDRSMLEAWVARAQERADEYSVIGFDDRCPDELLDAYIPLNDVMNTAPLDELDLDDIHITPERLREQEQRAVATRHHKWSLIARHDPSGDLAGFTEVMFADWMGNLVWQGDTGVDPAHRNKGLGRWLKAAMLLRLLDERPEAVRVDTWNAGSNEPMLAINIALGFRPLKHYGNWQLASDTLRDVVAKRA